MPLPNTRRSLATVLVIVLLAGLAALVSPPSAVAAPLAALAPGGSFVPVPPVRLADTRRTGGPTTSVAASFTDVLGVSSTAVSAVLVNVTVVDAVGSGYLQVTTGGNAGGASDGNFVARTASASLSLVGTYGGTVVRAYTSVRANIVVDLQGYVTSRTRATTDLFTPVPATRIADSRTASGLTTFTTGRTQTLDVRRRAALPTAAKAVIANLTIARADTSTYLTAWSGDGSRPTVSHVNAGRGEIVANRTLLPLDADGRVSIFNATGRTDVLVDVVGWVGPSPTGSYFTPQYAANARDRIGDSGDPVRSLTVTAAVGPAPPTVPTRAPSTDDLSPTTAVWLALAGDRPAGPGYLAAGPGGAAPGRTSDLNLVPGRAVANSGPVLVAPDGTVTVTASTATRIVADLSGWFQQAPSATTAPGLWSRYAPAPNSVYPLVASTRRTALPTWFVDGVYGATSLGGGIVSATAIAPDGAVWTATAPGSYDAGTNSWTEPRPVAGLTGVTALAGWGGGGTSPVFAVRQDGAVFGFGSNTRGELARPPSAEPTSTPEQIPLPAAAVRVGVSLGTGYAVLTDGSVWSWGDDSARLGRPATSAPWQPRRVPGLADPVAIGGDAGVVAAVDAAGATRWWGSATNVPATPTPVSGAGVCPVTATLHGFANGVFELCSDGTATRLSENGRAVRATVEGDGFVALGASTVLDNVRALFADGRVANVSQYGPGFYEAGFTGVTAIGGSTVANVTLVGAR